MDAPWWYAVVELGADRINGHFLPDFRGPLAIVAKEQHWRDYNNDCDAVRKILTAEKKPGMALHANATPKDRAGQVVGIVNVTGFEDDATASSLWFSGPTALVVQDGVYLQALVQWPAVGMAPRILHPFPPEKLGALDHALGRALYDRRSY